MDTNDYKDIPEIMDVERKLPPKVGAMLQRMAAAQHKQWYNRHQLLEQCVASLNRLEGLIESRLPAAPACRDQPKTNREETSTAE
jgi:hypothetical protein